MTEEITKNHVSSCDARDNRAHINNNFHYCDILQKEVDKEGFHKVPKESNENANADDTIESEGGPLKCPTCR